MTDSYLVVTYDFMTLVIAFRRMAETHLDTTVLTMMEMLSSESYCEREYCREFEKRNWPGKVVQKLSMSIFSE